MNIPLIKSLAWLLISILVAIAIQVPMLWHGNYAFILPNTLIVVLTVLSIRNTIEFDEVGLHKNKWFRYFLFMSNLFLFIYLLNRLELLAGIIDSMDMSALIDSSTITLSESVDLFKYINKEYLILSIASFVSMFVYNIKIIHKN